MKVRDRKVEKAGRRGRMLDDEEDTRRVAKYVQAVRLY